MKRILIILLCFVFVSVFAISGCTCSSDIGGCNGHGFGACIASCSDIMCGSNVWMPNSDPAVEGEHYRTPTYSLTKTSSSNYEFAFDMELLTLISGNIEICFVQSGVILDKITIKMFSNEESGTGAYGIDDDIQYSTYVETMRINFTKMYTLNTTGNGSVYCILNKMELLSSFSY